MAYTEVLFFLALEGSYYDSVSQRSCTGGKVIVLCQNKGDHFCQFYGRPFEEEEEGDDEEIDSLAIFSVSL